MLSVVKKEIVRIEVQVQAHIFNSMKWHEIILFWFICH